MAAVARIIAQLSLVGAALVAIVLGAPPSSDTPYGPALDTTLEHVSTPEESSPSVPVHEYLEITGGCGAGYGDGCVIARTKPDDAAAVAAKLRSGMVLKIIETIEEGSDTWYKVGFDSWIRYPERIDGEWYVAATTSLRVSKEVDEEILQEDQVGSSTKRILVDRSEQKLTAYDDDGIFMQTAVSTGLSLTPTPRGTFTVYKKTPARYMQGPLPGVTNQYYDLPGVPWNLYFTLQGGVVHGAYWHDNFGKPWSHGCVNLAPEEARLLYHWADVGTKVIIQD